MFETDGDKLNNFSTLFENDSGMAQTCPFYFFAAFKMQILLILPTLDYFFAQKEEEREKLLFPILGGQIVERTFLPKNILRTLH